MIGAAGCAVPIEEHPGLADARDAEADDAVVAAALLDDRRR